MGPPSPVDGGIGGAPHIPADLGEAGLDGGDGLAPDAGQPANEPAAGAGGPAGAAPLPVSFVLPLSARADLHPRSHSGQVALLRTCAGPDRRSRHLQVFD